MLDLEIIHNAGFSHFVLAFVVVIVLGASFPVAWLVLLVSKLDEVK